MNIAFFLYYRAGSSLFHNLINSTGSSLDLHYLPTIPRNTYRVKYVSGPDLDLMKESKHPIAVSVHVGNWWGRLPSDNIPGPFESPSPMKWSRKELSKLTGEWKFISLIRDGRNHIASLINKKESLEKALFEKDPEEYFRIECKAFRNRARVALDCSSWENYRIFRFEDLVQNPVGTITNMFSYFGLKKDKDYYSKVASSYFNPNKANNHSSFSDNSKMNYRWHGWTPEQREVFNEIAGQELVDLGYEKNSDWSL